MKNVLAFLALYLTSIIAFSQYACNEEDAMLCQHAKAHSHKDYVFNPQLQSELLQDYDVKFYFLTIHLENDTVYVEGAARVDAVVTAATMDTFALELVSILTVDSARVNGSLVTVNHSGDDLFLLLGSGLNQGDNVSAEVFYHGTPPYSGFFSGMSNAYNSQYDKNVTWSLSEPWLGKEWWPVKQDLQDKADSSWVFIITDENNLAGSQGLLTAITQVGNNKLQFEWKSKYPIAYYLISVAVAEYEEYNIYAKPEEMGGDSILIQNYIYQGSLSQYKSGIDNTVEFIELMSDLFGLYPFREEKYGHCLTQLPGGMEHQTMTTIGNFGFDLVAHELGHMWFGDNVTCATWSDIFINEGFATYSNYLAIEYVLGYQSAQDWLEGTHTNVMTQPGGSVYIPPDQATTIGRIFNGRLSYNKGACIIHMIRYELQDDDMFFQVLQDFQEQYSDSVATGVDFQGVVEAVSGMDFDDFFAQWYFGEGFPKYEIVWNQVEGVLNMNVTQTTSTSITPLFKMLMPYKLNFDDGTDSTINLYQTDNFTQFNVPLNKVITSIEVDPEQWNLMELISNYEGIEETESPAYFTFGPNPVKDQVRIFLPNENGGNYQVIVSDLSGREIIRHERSGKEITFDLSTLQKGAYFIMVQDGKHVITRKFVKI
ncbi:MAG: M1 family aminopeptidase [Bacteroidota bacterium]|nr:M1 family aminopeptidase [Bacteroidota bacterium]